MIFAFHWFLFEVLFLRKKKNKYIHSRLDIKYIFMVIIMVIYLW